MDKFVYNWLPNIVVTGVFWLLDHLAVVVGVAVVLRGAFARLKAMWPHREGDLVPDASTGMLSGIAISTSTAAGYLAPLYRAPPNMGQFVMPSELYDTHRAVQENLRFERNKMVAVLASTENLGVPSGAARSPSGSVGPASGSDSRTHLDEQR